MKPVTATINSFLDSAFVYFNHCLFDGKLPPCAIVLHRHKRSLGYFWHDRFASKTGETADEIAINPDHLLGRTPEEIVSTLVHEMCHCYQQHFGTPTRNGYHNKEFAQIMKMRGLQCTHDGTQNGRSTGQNMTHLIMPDGQFHVCYQAWQTVKRIDWGSSEIAPEEKRKRKSNKTRYECPVCGALAWGKPDLHVYCGHGADLLDDELPTRMNQNDGETED